MMAKRRGKGEGCISKREDGTFQGYVTVGYDVDTGRPKRKYFSGKKRKDIQDRINEIISKVNSGTYREPSKLRVAEWFNLWIEEYQKNHLRPTTWESYKMQIDKHILPNIGHLQLNQLDTANLQSLYNSKQKDGARFDGKPGPLSPRAVRYIHQICHAALGQAKTEGKINVNPADATKLPADKKKDIQFFDTEQVKAFLSAAKETKHFTAYFLVLNTGLRRGELLGLRWQDVDLKKGNISVKQSLVRAHGKLTFQEPKTKLSKRTIGISNEVIEALRFHRKRQQDEMKEAGESYSKSNNLVFCNELGKPYCPRGFTRHFARLIDRTNKAIEEKGKENGWGLEVMEAKKLKKIPFHGLRHTFATLCLQQGTDPRTTQEALGHHAVSFTLDIYSGVTAQMKQEATKKIGSFMASCLK